MSGPVKRGPQLREAEAMILAAAFRLRRSYPAGAAVRALEADLCATVDHYTEIARAPTAHNQPALAVMDAAAALQLAGDTRRAHRLREAFERLEFIPLEVRT